MYCQKNNCNNLKIPRGKYCELHRTKKKKIDNINRKVFQENYESKNNEVENISEIIREQNNNYNYCLEEDMKRLCSLEEKKEMDDILELSKKTFFEDLKNKVINEPDYESKKNYLLRFKLPSGITLKRKFYENVKFENIRNFLDFYFYENNLNIFNYNLVVFPKKTFTIENNSETLLENNLENNLTFFINNLDA